MKTTFSQKLGWACLRLKSSHPLMMPGWEAGISQRPLEKQVSNWSSYFCSRATACLSPAVSAGMVSAKKMEMFARTLGR